MCKILFIWKITLPVLFVINFTPELLNCQARERFSSLKKNARDEVVTELEEVSPFSEKGYLCGLFILLCVSLYLPNLMRCNLTQTDKCCKNYQPKVIGILIVMCSNKIMS